MVLVLEVDKDMQERILFIEIRNNNYIFIDQ